MRRKLSLQCYLFEHNYVIYVLVKNYLKVHISDFYPRKIMKIRINKCLTLQVSFNNILNSFCKS